MKYSDLTENCKTALNRGRCLGCTALENKDFKGNPNCMYSKIPTAQESINAIHKILGMGEQVTIK